MKKESDESDDQGHSRDVDPDLAPDYNDGVYRYTDLPCTIRRPQTDPSELAIPKVPTISDFKQTQALSIAQGQTDGTLNKLTFSAGQGQRIRYTGMSSADPDSNWYDGGGGAYFNSTLVYHRHEQENSDMHAAAGGRARDPSAPIVTEASCEEVTPVHVASILRVAIRGTDPAGVYEYECANGDNCVAMTLEHYMASKSAQEIVSARAREMLTTQGRPPKTPYNPNPPPVGVRLMAAMNTSEYINWVTNRILPAVRRPCELCTRRDVFVDHILNFQGAVDRVQLPYYHSTHPVYGYKQEAMHAWSANGMQSNGPGFNFRKYAPSDYKATSFDKIAPNLKLMAAEIKMFREYASRGLCAVTPEGYPIVPCYIETTSCFPMARLAKSQMAPLAIDPRVECIPSFQGDAFPPGTRVTTTEEATMADTVPVKLSNIGQWIQQEHEYETRDVVVPKKRRGRKSKAESDALKSAPAPIAPPVGPATKSGRLSATCPVSWTEITHCPAIAHALSSYATTQFGEIINTIAQFTGHDITAVAILFAPMPAACTAVKWILAHAKINAMARTDADDSECPQRMLPCEEAVMHLLTMHASWNVAALSSHTMHNYALFLTVITRQYIIDEFKHAAGSLCIKSAQIKLRDHEPEKQASGSSKRIDVASPFGLSPMMARISERIATLSPDSGNTPNVLTNLYCPFSSTRTAADRHVRRMLCGKVKDDGRIVGSGNGQVMSRGSLDAKLVYVGCIEAANTGLYRWVFAALRSCMPVDDTHLVGAEWLTAIRADDIERAALCVANKLGPVSPDVTGRYSLELYKAPGSKLASYTQRPRGRQNKRKMYFDKIPVVYQQCRPDNARREFSPCDELPVCDGASTYKLRYPGHAATVLRWLTCDAMTKFGFAPNLMSNMPVEDVLSLTKNRQFEARCGLTLGDVFDKFWKLINRIKTLDAGSYVLGTLCGPSSEFVPKHLLVHPPVDPVVRRAEKYDVAAAMLLRVCLAEALEARAKDSATSYRVYAFKLSHVDLATTLRWAKDGSPATCDRVLMIENPSTRIALLDVVYPHDDRAKLSGDCAILPTVFDLMDPLGSGDPHRKTGGDNAIKKCIPRACNIRANTNSAYAAGTKNPAFLMFLQQALYFTLIGGYPDSNRLPFSSAILAVSKMETIKQSLFSRLDACMSEFTAIRHANAKAIVGECYHILGVRTAVQIVNMALYYVHLGKSLSVVLSDIITSPFVQMGKAILHTVALRLAESVYRQLASPASNPEIVEVFFPVKEFRRRMLSCEAKNMSIVNVYDRNLVLTIARLIEDASMQSPAAFARWYDSITKTAHTSVGSQTTSTLCDSIAAAIMASVIQPSTTHADYERSAKVAQALRTAFEVVSDNGVQSMLNGTILEPRGQLSRCHAVKTLLLEIHTHVGLDMDKSRSNLRKRLPLFTVAIDGMLDSVARIMCSLVDDDEDESGGAVFDNGHWISKPRGSSSTAAAGAVQVNDLTLAEFTAKVKRGALKYYVTALELSDTTPTNAQYCQLLTDSIEQALNHMSEAVCNGIMSDVVGNFSEGLYKPMKMMIATVSDSLPKIAFSNKSLLLCTGIELLAPLFEITDVSSLRTPEGKSIFQSADTVLTEQAKSVIDRLSGRINAAYHNWKFSESELKTELINTKARPTKRHVTEMAAHTDDLVFTDPIVLEPMLTNACTTGDIASELVAIPRKVLYMLHVASTFMRRFRRASIVKAESLDAYRQNMEADRMHADSSFIQSNHVLVRNTIREAICNAIASNREMFGSFHSQAPFIGSFMTCVTEVCNHIRSSFIKTGTLPTSSELNAVVDSATQRGWNNRVFRVARQHDAIKVFSLLQQIENTNIAMDIKLARGSDPEYIAAKNDRRELMWSYINSYFGAHPHCSTWDIDFDMQTLYAFGMRDGLSVIAQIHCAMESLYGDDEMVRIMMGFKLQDFQLAATYYSCLAKHVSMHAYNIGSRSGSESILAGLYIRSSTSRMLPMCDNLIDVKVCLVCKTTETQLIDQGIKFHNVAGGDGITQGMDGRFYCSDRRGHQKKQEQTQLKSQQRLMNKRDNAARSQAQTSGRSSRSTADAQKTTAELIDDTTAKIAQSCVLDEQDPDKEITEEIRRMARINIEDTLRADKLEGCEPPYRDTKCMTTCLTTPIHSIVSVGKVVDFMAKSCCRGENAQLSKFGISRCVSCGQPTRVSQDNLSQEGQFECNACAHDRREMKFTSVFCAVCGADVNDIVIDMHNRMLHSLAHGLGTKHYTPLGTYQKRHRRPNRSGNGAADEDPNSAEARTRQTKTNYETIVNSLTHQLEKLTTVIDQDGALRPSKLCRSEIRIGPALPVSHMSNARLIFDDQATCRVLLVNLCQECYYNSSYTKGIPLRSSILRRTLNHALQALADTYTKTQSRERRYHEFK